MWVALYTVWAVVFFVALTRLLERSPGVKVSVILSACAALASFLLISSVA